MYKFIKTLVPLLLICFVITFIIPSEAMAIWPFDRTKAVDNEHVTYNISFKSDYFNDIRVGEKFSMYISAYYDDAPIANLNIKDLKGFQLINYFSWNDEFVLRAPHDGGEYSLLMEGEAKNQKITFSVPISVKDKGYTNPTSVIFSTLVVIGVLGGIVFWMLNYGK